MISVGAGEGMLRNFSLVYHFLISYSLSQGDGQIQTEILTQRVVKLKTTTHLPLCQRGAVVEWLERHSHGTERRREFKARLCHAMGGKLSPSTEK